MSRWAWTLVAALTAGLTPPGGAPHLSAQDGPERVDALERVDSLAAAGMMEDARRSLTTWWEEERGAASQERVQRALWLRGLLTVDPSMAAVDFQRLVVEYPGGPWTDDALLRLARVDGARGRPDLAARRLTALLRDHPSSTLRPEARDLLVRMEEDARAMPSEAPAGDTPPPEPSSARASVDSVRGPPPSASSAAPEASSPPTGTYGVQLGAFSTEHRARLLLERARLAGIEARLARLPGESLVRVRAGGFSRITEAVRLRSEVRDLGFDAIVVEDGAAEEPVP